MHVMAPGWIGAGTTKLKHAHESGIDLPMPALDGEMTHLSITTRLVTKKTTSMMMLRIVADSRQVTIERLAA